MLEDFDAGKAPGAWWFAMNAGRYREASDLLRTSIDALRGRGYVRMALFWLGPLGRLRLVLGELDHVADIQAEGDELLERAEPGSNAAAQFQGLAVNRALLVDLDYGAALEFSERFQLDRTDVRWMSGAIQLGMASSRAAMGNHRQALDELSANLAVVERGCLGDPNYPLAVYCAAQTLWSLDCADHVEVLERNLHAKVLQPDFSYFETDGRWTAALLCALTQRYDEAHGWFQQAYDRLTAQGAILLLPHVCYDEALMELRRGPSRDRDLALRRLDEATRWVDHIGLPNHVPRIDDLRSQLSS